MARVLITGASKGIGRAAAMELVRRGHEVIAPARNLDAITDLPAAAHVTLDVTDDASVAAAIDAAGGIDILVSNAGETPIGTVQATPLTEFDRLHQLNTVGAIRVVKAVLPGMRQQQSGRIVFVSSILGRLALPLLGAGHSRRSRRPWRSSSQTRASTSPRCNRRRSAPARSNPHQSSTGSRRTVSVCGGSPLPRR